MEQKNEKKHWTRWLLLPFSPIAIPFAFLYGFAQGTLAALLAEDTEDLLSIINKKEKKNGTRKEKNC